MRSINTLLGIGAAVLVLAGCGKNKVSTPIDNISNHQEVSSCVEERLNGFYVLDVSPVRYSNALIGRIADYQTKNRDIGVFPIVENDSLTGFGVYAARPGAGYTGMDEDIKNLVN